MAIVPQTTRLRFVSAKDPTQITVFLSKIKFRVQIYDIVHDGEKWFCWFVPPDDAMIDIDNIDLD